MSVVEMYTVFSCFTHKQIGVLMLSIKVTISLLSWRILICYHLLWFNNIWRQVLDPFMVFVWICTFLKMYIMAVVPAEMHRLKLQTHHNVSFWSWRAQLASFLDHHDIGHRRRKNWAIPQWLPAERWIWWRRELVTFSTEAFHFSAFSHHIVYLCGSWPFVP